MSDTPAVFTAETAGQLKAKLEQRLNRGESFDSPQMKQDIAAYVAYERGLFHSTHPVDKNCQSVEPWNREPYQIVRDTTDTDFFTADETGLVRRFVEEVRGWLAYDLIQNKWYFWTGSCWDTSGRGEMLAMQFTAKLTDDLFYESGDYFECRLEHGRLIIEPSKEFRSMCKNAAKINTRAQIVKAARAELFAEFDQDERIPFKNGMFNPDTQEFTPHDWKNYNTRLCPTALKLEVPDFEPGQQFMRDISCGDASWINSLFEIIGESIRYGNKHQCFFVFYGSGRNGKSVFVDWLQATLGNLTADCAAIEISKQNSSHRQTTLFDSVSRCRLVFCKEAGGVQFDDELIKALTGEQRVCLTRIFRGTQELPVCATLFLITNTLPSVDKGGESMLRRQVGTPFEFKAEHPDENLLSRLNTEEGREWLLSQIVDHMLPKENTHSFKDRLCPRMQHFTADLVKSADNVFQFLETCCAREPGLRTSRHELYKAFCGFAYSDQGISPQPLKFRIGEKSFGDRVRGFGLTPLDGKQRTSSGLVCRYVYQGIGLNQEGEEFYRIETAGYL